MTKIAKGKLEEVKKYIENELGVKFKENENTYETPFYEHLDFKGIVIFKIDLEVRTFMPNGNMWDFPDESLIEKGLLIKEDDYTNPEIENIKKSTNKFFDKYTK